ncbi:MAG: hybrid sensor histidine kinase/response regulator [Alphaproteobacteria bacterium]|nr:hybrid sensor histidine kinase/response regulator [Alphaproteobacteria bacterium]OJV46971.1 MAG: hypothetical protein BGO28_06505 [Alphaproteobacteria bacterium 43-37]
MKLFLIEDNPGDIRLIMEIFGRQDSDHFMVAHSIDEGLSRIQESEPDILLLDLSLPDGHGVENVSRIKEHFPDLPVIVLTGLDDEKIALRALREGAQDYIVKGDLNFSGVRRSVFYAIERMRVEKQLRTALERAEVANHSKTAFLANMSHELRTPLNAIMGFAELMEREIFGPLGNKRYLEYAHDIHKSGSYLLELINDLLDLAKAEAGKLELSETVVNIQRVLEESVELLGPQTKEANVLIQVQIEARLPFLFGDARFLKQILINIISNAIKFTPPGGVVTIFATTNKLRGIMVTISDTGIGMVSEDIPKALSSFGQIASPHNKSHRGTGLGLPLSKRLVELHGGVLSLNSQIGVGTTVTIQFPAWRSRSENGQQVVH